MKEKIKELIIKNEYRNLYILIGIITVCAYYPIRQFIIDQSAWSIVKIAPLTVNMLLCYFLWGVFAERKWKSKPQWIRLGLDFVGFMIITIVFRYGFDMKTILG